MESILLREVLQIAAYQQLLNKQRTELILSNWQRSSVWEYPLLVVLGTLGTHVQKRG